MIPLTGIEQIALIIVYFAIGFLMGSDDCWIPADNNHWSDRVVFPDILLTLFFWPLIWLKWVIIVFCIGLVQLLIYWTNNWNRLIAWYTDKG